LKHLALALLLVSVTAGGVSAQLAFYVDENGKRIYINANPAPAPKQPVTKPTALRLARPARTTLVAPVQSRSPFQTPPGLRAAVVPAAALTPTAPPPSVEAVIHEAAKRHDVDPELVKAIVGVESNFSPHAVSNKGAMGLMQLMPATARRFGVGNVFNPVENVDGGVRYLKYLLGYFDGDLKLSVAAYNAGENAVVRYGGVPPYRETQNYVKKIGDVYSMLHPQRVETGPQRLVRTLDENGRVLYTNLQ
jgi:soluble lytic murein transglycosylase-like protein